ncbi:GvpL/GvpF family gas vesicle protein [Streptomyces sp. NPDC033538]|uniref:GvpL/GvpF family gas vesicle protein n=1 Tax=Streptomyces sp. NPDC033538 TaxID=3155367 RepID=UPI0033C5AF03
MNGPDALYVYALLPDPGPAPAPLGAGIEDSPLHLVRDEAGGLAALVHHAKAQPYEGADDDVRRWIVAHDRAVEAAWRAAGSVLPMTFNVLVPAGVDGSGEDQSAEERLRSWLVSHREDLTSRLSALHGLAEYRVEITLDNTEALAADDRARELATQMESSPPGLRRLLGKRLEGLRRESAESFADRLYATTRRRLTAVAEDLLERRRSVRNTEETDVLTVALLVRESEVTSLGLVLAELDEEYPALRVRFLGPWPPYSFTEVQPDAERGAENAS